MKRHAYRVICVLFLFASGTAFGGEIALTFDDVPRPDSRRMTGLERDRMLLAHLQEAGVEGAMFFAIGSEVDAGGLQRLHMIHEAGHVIGNHSQTHSHPEQLGLDGYVADIEAADAILSGLPGFVRFYRYPFLDEGRDVPMRDGIRDALRRLDYRQGYVTVDSYDWYMDALLLSALKQGRSVDYRKLGEVYVRLMAENVAFYDGVARRVLGRSPRHVLLLHENDLAALYIADLVAELRRRGWQIIPALEAYRDPIAAEVTDTLFNGQGRIAAIAEMQGVSRRDLVPEQEDEQWLDDWFESQGVFGPAPK